MPLAPENQTHLTAAEGYLTLGLFIEAEAELARVSPDAQPRAEVLMVRVHLYQATKRWRDMQAAAMALVSLEPFDPQWVLALAYAIRRANSIAAARVILAAALNQHPTNPMIQYNLACYDCQLGELRSAKKFLKTAFGLDPSLKSLALDDEDLEPLWMSL